MFAHSFKKTSFPTVIQKIKNVKQSLQDATQGWYSKVQANNADAALMTVRCTLISNAAVVFISHDTTLLDRRMFSNAHETCDCDLRFTIPIVNWNMISLN